MGLGGRLKPPQQPGLVVPGKYVSLGIKHALWTAILGLMLFGLFLSHSLLHVRTRIQPIIIGGVEVSSEDQQSNVTILRYARYNPPVDTERDKIAFILHATEFGEKSIKDVMFDKEIKYRARYFDPRRYKLARTGKSWMLPFTARALQPHMPKFVEISKAWLGSDEFNPGPIMEELMEKVKRPLERNATRWTGLAEEVLKGKKYQNCAVVGNSGILLNGSYGRLIDGHEMVIRLNNAGTTKYVKHVGSKTTLSFMNSNIFRTCSVRPKCWCLVYGEEVPTLFSVSQAIHLLYAAKCDSEETAALVVTPSLFDALCAAIAKWYSLTNFIQTTGRPLSKWDSVHHDEYFHSSSGFQAVLVAVGICDSVDLFGFGKFVSVSHHYHTEQKQELSLHDYAAEYRFYDDLVHNRTIPFFTEAGVAIPPVKIFY